MARIVFISICDRNAHGLRMMSSSLQRHGHQCHIVFLKRYGRSPLAEAEPDDYPWIGLDAGGREFRYAHGSPITDRELGLLRGLLSAPLGCPLGCLRHSFLGWLGLLSRPTLSRDANVSRVGRKTGVGAT